MLLKRLQRLRNSDPDEFGSGSAVDDDYRDDLDDQGKASSASDPGTDEVDDNPGHITGDGTGASPDGLIEPINGDELIVTIEGEQQDEEEIKGAPTWAKELRKRNRENAKLLRQKDEEIERLRGGKASEQSTLPEKPTLENPGTGNPDDSFDAEVYERELEKWYAKKAAFEAKQAEARKQQEEVAKEWQSLVETYNKGKSRFPESKMKEAEDEVVSVLPSARQSLLMEVADDSAQLVIALGSSPDTLRKLASIKSDAKFVKELTKIEGKITVKPATKTAPPPERTLSGNGKTPGSASANLDRLREQAEKTGDYTAYYAAKSKAKAK